MSRSPSHTRRRAPRAKTDRLAFVVGDMTRLAEVFAPASFDALISVDTLYFVQLDDALPQLMALLKPGGRLVALLHPRRGPRDPHPAVPARETLSPDKTPFGAALERRGLAYHVQDFSARQTAPRRHACWKPSRRPGPRWKRRATRSCTKAARAEANGTLASARSRLRRALSLPGGQAMTTKGDLIGEGRTAEILRGAITGW